jgi:ABC-2 type transport system permease protein
MKKFLAVVKYEYRKVVLRWAFLIGTFIFPVLAAGFGLVPALIFSIKSEPTRIAVVDPTGDVLPRLKENLSSEAIAAKAREPANLSANDLTATQQERMKKGANKSASGFVFVNYDSANKPGDQVRSELTGEIRSGSIDAYLIIPPDVSSVGSAFEFRSRKGGDFVANDTLRDALNQAVRAKRLSDADISIEKVKLLSQDINFDSKGLSESGEEKDSDMLMAASFVIGLMIYITLMIYGQVIMGAVVEEKDTRIAEILFSSAKPFQLMMGKLVGVGLAGLTQLGIWVVSLGALAAFLSVQSGSSSEIFRSLPQVTPLMIVYFLVFFLLGYFLFASIYGLIGSMVTNVQEGGQFALPATLLLVMGYLFSFGVIRDPNSTMSFWVSISPFLAPITMPVRIMAEMPPLWQILLSMAINAVAIACLVWLASRVYRIGMLMYGKRATIPEVWKWIRQS